MRGLSAALAALVLLACGDGGGDPAGATSVWLAIRNGAGLPRPDTLWIDADDPDLAGSLRKSTAAVPPGTEDDLGDVVIYPGTGPRLRVVVWGVQTGMAVSRGEVLVAPVAMRQIRSSVVLAAFTDTDGGPTPPPDGAASEGDAGEDASAPAPDTDGGVAIDAPVANDARIVDASPPDTTAKKGTGEACGGGSECTSGACRDGVCCDMACSGECRTCKAAGMPVGKCSPLPEATACGGASDCRPNGQLSYRECRMGVCQDVVVNCKAMNKNCADGERMCR